MLKKLTKKENQVSERKANWPGSHSICIVGGAIECGGDPAYFNEFISCYSLEY